MQDESAELCFIFRSACSVLYFPLEIWYWKCCSVYIAINQLKYRLRSCTTGNIAHGHGLKANIALGFDSRYISLSTTNISCSALAVVYILIYGSGS